VRRNSRLVLNGKCLPRCSFISLQAAFTAFFSDPFHLLVTYLALPRHFVTYADAVLLHPLPINTTPQA